MISKTLLINRLGSLSNEATIKDALEIAELAHKTQKRDNGNNYLKEHIYTIVISLLDKYSDREILSKLIPIAILHDVLEDSDYSEKDMAKKVGLDITRDVKLLTKLPEERAQGLSQEEKMSMNKKYLRRILKGNDIVKIVKLEDRLQNLSCITEETFNIKPEKYRRYIYETRKLFIPLTKKINDCSIDYSMLLENECKRIEKILNKNQ